jgi:WD40 repeat protein
LTSCVAFSPDGTKLFTGSHAHEAAIWETSTGKQLHKLLHPQLSWIEHGAWADHGKKVVFTGVGSLQVFDAETGAWHATYQDRRGGNSTCDFSRNGNLFVYQMDVLSLASASTGAILDQLPEAKNLQALRLAPHQQTIAANHQDRTLRIWELSTHGIRWQAKTRAMNNFTTVLAFSNDGRWIASGQGWQYSSEPKEITIYNADTGVPRCRFPGQPALHKMVFSPNDHQLVSFSADGTGLVWAVPPLPATAPWSKDEGARNWDLLAHQDAAQAAPAVARFLETNTETIAFFQAKLAPIPAVAPQIIRDWITQLDSGKFADREKAFQELAKLGGLAEPVLQEAKTKTLGAEGQRRVMMLLQQIQNKELTAAERQA